MTDLEALDWLQAKAELFGRTGQASVLQEIEAFFEARCGQPATMYIMSMVRLVRDRSVTAATLTALLREEMKRPTNVFNGKVDAPHGTFGTDASSGKRINDAGPKT